MNAVLKPAADYKVRDIKLAEFGRKPQNVKLPNGEKFTAFSWEQVDRAEQLRKDAGLK